MANTGYQPGFMGKALPVAFPKLNKAQKNDLAIADQKKTGELKYPHFSLFLSKSRKFPFFTATNIDGKLFKSIPRTTIFPSGTDKWSIDARVKDFQWGASLYSAPKSDFQRGHMTKREDPQWGKTEDTALQAAIATFHFTNCVPQVAELNTKEWGKLETFILEKTSVPDKLRVSVFTGPVLAVEDPVFISKVGGEDVQIPTLFWKIVYYSTDGKTVSMAGFLMGQQNSLVKKGIVVQKVQPSAERLAIQAEIFQNFEDAAIYQVNIGTIEKLSGLRFAAARQPFMDSRPLKLIIEKVQVPATAEARKGINVLEDTHEQVLFSNMKLG
jgi:endonuclease G